MSITLDDSTSASHPGQIRISADKFLTYHGVRGLKRKYFLLLFKKPLDQLYDRLWNADFVHSWIRTSEHFLHGCLNPSVIINKEKGIIATYTDLTNNYTEPTSVIKISQEKLHLISGIELANGQEIPTVSLYSRSEVNPDATAWIDFEPLVPHCFSDNLRECNELFSQLEGNEWKCLSEGLKQVENPEKLGLYHINLDSKLTNNTYSRG